MDSDDAIRSYLVQRSKPLSSKSLISKIYQKIHLPHRMLKV